MNIEDMTINEREEYIKNKIPEDVYNGLSDDWDNFFETCFSTVYNLIEDNFDEDGLDFVGKGKKGGTYYIDLYEEISTDYFPYINKKRRV